jgi:NTP pyrophosphatase (non-canonical NTP hydrolase)
MEFRQLVDRALEIRRQYAELERSRCGRPWTGQEIALGFVGDVGDLVKLVQAAEGVRHIPNAREKLAHELADCLWSVLVLSDVYGIDLERAFVATMDGLERHLAETARTEAR